MSELLSCLSVRCAGADVEVLACAGNMMPMQPWLQRVETQVCNTLL